MSPGFWRIRAGRGVAAAPVEWARALVDPAIAGDHLDHPLESEAGETQGQADGVVDEIVVERQELALEQRVVQEAHGHRQDQDVERHVPPRSPGRREGPAGEERRAAAEQHAHQEKDPERLLVRYQFRGFHIDVALAS